MSRPRFAPLPCRISVSLAVKIVLSGTDLELDSLCQEDDVRQRQVPPSTYTAPTQVLA